MHNYCFYDLTIFSADWDSVPDFLPSDWSKNFDFGRKFVQNEAQERSDSSGNSNKNKVFNIYY